MVPLVCLWLGPRSVGELRRGKMDKAEGTGGERSAAWLCGGICRALQRLTPVRDSVTSERGIYPEKPAQRGRAGRLPEPSLSQSRWAVRERGLHPGVQPPWLL